MNAAELVAALELHGVQLRVRGDRLDVEAAAEPPRPLLDALTKQKAEVLAFLREREAPAPPVAVVDRRAETAAPVPESLPSGERTVVAGPLGELVQPWDKRPNVPVVIEARPVSTAEIFRATGTLPPGYYYGQASAFSAELTSDTVARLREYVSGRSRFP